MTSAQPLIDTLLREVDPTRKLTARQRTAFRAGVRKFSQNPDLGQQGLEKIYVIIRGWWEYYDSSKPEDSPDQPLPYSGTMTPSGPEFDYEALPETLKRILCIFIEKHKDFMESAITPEDPTAQTQSEQSRD